MSDLLLLLLPVASGGVLITFVTLRARSIRAKQWLSFTALVAVAEAILCVFAWRDAMGVEEPFLSGIPFAVGFTCAFLVGLAVFVARHRSTAFRVGTAIAATILTTACSPSYVLFLGCTLGPCI